jgi:hypothetical protein
MQVFPLWASGSTELMRMSALRVDARTRHGPVAAQQRREAAHRGGPAGRQQPGGPRDRADDAVRRSGGIHTHTGVADGPAPGILLEVTCHAALVNQ